MNILIDIGHPAHVHLFKHYAWIMQKKNHKVLFTCRDREFVTHLLTVYGFRYKNFGRHYKSLLGKLLGLLINEFQMLLTSLRFRPDIYLSHGSTIASHSSFILRKPNIALEDTFNMEQVKLSLPFSDVVLTGDYTHTSLGEKEIQYPGYHELAYLHPNVFKPNDSVLESLGVKEGEKYAVVRFVAWNASHDVGHKGLSVENKVKLVKELSKYLKVFISSEGDLPNKLKAYQINIRPEQMHDALNFAHLFIGESGTMASECAMLGTPAIFLNDNHFGCIDDQARYGLIYTYTESDEDQLKAIRMAVELAQTDNIKEEYRVKRDRMLRDKIDVTAFMVWFVENYPESEKEMRGEGFSFERFK